MNTFSALLLSIYCSFSTPSPKVDACKVVIKVTNIRSGLGDIKFGVYKDQKSYEDDSPMLKKNIGKAGLQDGTVQGEVYLVPGNYGIALVDDENNNGKMDFGFIMPKEGFGFSNYYHSGLSLSRPPLTKFTFTAVAGQTVYVTAKVKYM